MEELLRVRSNFRHAYRTLWRDERLLRYVHWLHHRTEPDFNIVGSWRDADIKTEIKLWQIAATSGLGEDDVIEMIRAMLADRFGFDLSYATTIATDARLASAGMPIWNELTGSLLPQMLGPLRIVAVTDFEHQSVGMGMGYAYLDASTSAAADLYIYSHGEQDLEDGTEDARVQQQFEIASAQLQQHRKTGDAKSPMRWGPVVESLHSPTGREYRFLSVMFAAPTAGEDVLTGVALTSFCNVFLKVRSTFPALSPDSELVSDVARASIEKFNTDLAEFCCHFS
jgi:hypothetical protein